MLYMLWDPEAEGRSGHARSIDDCLRLGAGDITIRTSLLEHRLVCGDAHPPKSWMTASGPSFRPLGSRIHRGPLAESAPTERHRRQGGQCAMS